MAKRTSPARPTDLAHIHENYRALAIPIGEPALDPRNANQHTEEGLSLIGNSVSEFQQLIPIVVNRATGIVLKGNGTLKAMRERGFKYVAVTYVDFDPTAATKFSIVDNQAGRLSGWDVEQLNGLLAELEASGIEHTDIGFSDAEIAKLLQDSGEAAPKKPHKSQDSPDQTGELKTTFQIIITCDSEEDQLQTLEWLVEHNKSCKALFT